MYLHDDMNLTANFPERMNAYFSICCCLCIFIHILTITYKPQNYPTQTLCSTVNFGSKFGSNTSITKYFKSPIYSFTDVYRFISQLGHKGLESEICFDQRMNVMFEGENGCQQPYLKGRIYILHQIHVVIDHLKYSLLNKVLRCLSTLPSRMPSRKIRKQNKTSEAILLNQKKIWNNTVSKGQSNESKKPSDILMVISICFGSKCVIQGIFKLHKGTSKLFLFH